MTESALSDLTWQRSASGLAIRTRYRGLHVSVWRRPQGGAYQVTVSGSLPATIVSTAQATRFVADTILRCLDDRKAV